MIGIMCTVSRVETGAAYWTFTMWSSFQPQGRWGNNPLVPLAHPSPGDFDRCRYRYRWLWTMCGPCDLSISSATGSPCLWIFPIQDNHLATPLSAPPAAHRTHGRMKSDWTYRISTEINWLKTIILSEYNCFECWQLIHNIIRYFLVFVSSFSYSWTVFSCV